METRKRLAEDLVMKIKEPIIKDTLDFNKWMYSLTGFATVDFPSKTHRLLYIMYRTCVQVIFGFVLTLMYYDIYVFYNNLPMLSFTLGIVLFASVGLVKMIVMHLRKNELEGMKKRLDENLNLPWVEEEDWERALKKRYADILKKLITFIYLSVLAEATLTAALPLITNGKQKFFVPSSSLNYLATTRFYVPIYVMHIFAMLLFLVNFISNDMTFISLVSRLCENLDIIETKLKRFNNSYNSAPLNWTSNDEKKLLSNKDVKIINRREMRKGNKILIKRCIMHHQAVLRELKIISNIYSIPVLLHFIFGPFLCGFLFFVILSKKDQEDVILQQTIFALLAGVYLLLYSWFGSYIMQKFQDIRFAFYSYPWYEMDLETRKLILIVLLGLGNSGKLKAGKIFDVSLPEYLTIGKTAYNVVTVLKNTT